MGVGAGLYMYDVVVKKFTFAISSPDEFLSTKDGIGVQLCRQHVDSLCNIVVSKVKRNFKS